MKTRRQPASLGSALIEVMVTLFILAIGLLGIAGLQARIHVLEFESYQRAQALVVMNDLSERIFGNRPQAATYVAEAPNFLTHTGVIKDCNDDAIVGSPVDPVKKDLCEIGNVLNGEGEKQGGSNLGAMERGMACITAFEVPATGIKAFGRCPTGVQVEVAWRGRSSTVVPASTCGAGLYGSDDGLRRAVSTKVGTGDVAC